MNPAAEVLRLNMSMVDMEIYLESKLYSVGADQRRWPRMILAPFV